MGELTLYLLLDLVLSFTQYYHTPFYGDLASHVLPDEVIQPVFNDPLGLKAVSSGIGHSNPNRFFAHWMLSSYFQHVPFWIQKLLSPVSSVYLASAIVKIMVQIIFMTLVAMLVSGERKFTNYRFLLAAAIAMPLFQVYGFWSRLGIVDQSIVYTFFYAVPLILLMVFLLPLFRRLLFYKRTSHAIHLLLVPLIIVLPLSGPLVPAVILLTGFLLFVNYAQKAWNEGFKMALQSIPATIF